MFSRHVCVLFGASSLGCDPSPPRAVPLVDSALVVSWAPPASPPPASPTRGQPLSHAATRQRALAEAAELSVGCETRDRTWRLRVKPRARRSATLEAIERLLQSESAVCEPNGWIEIEVTTDVLERLFGSHLELQCIAGMGNSADAPYLGATVTPSAYVPRELALHASRVEMATDPKGVLFGESVECSKLFR